MNQEKKTKKELEEMFENFLFSVDDYMDNILEKTKEQGYILDFSLQSLANVEKYLVQNRIRANDDDINDSAAYLGEVIRKTIGGRWTCSLDLKNNSIYYGRPVITEYTTPKDLEFSPFDCILNYLADPEPGYFIKAVTNDLEDEPLNLDDIPTEE